MRIKTGKNLACGHASHVVHRMPFMRCTTLDARHSMRGTVIVTYPFTFQLHNKRLKTMDIYQIASQWEVSNIENDPSDPRETPPFDPRPEVPAPDVPEETPPFERDPETPPISPEPEMPPIEPVIPEVEPLRDPGGEPDIPAFN
ncbi:hypothetical protein LXM25_23060 [Dyadobacter sp. LJ53]|uniref:hypothetical protein n=1 Tax=Dyadobacter chenwenxiniae TaxID=2906456 RepID=UPI001F277441|nr:hypothetical protein [Dyadobacter chenwenxiniae]MCF0052967.1 hypothetical protein [Dyadobacter chenwenxiniae]